MLQYFINTLLCLTSLYYSLLGCLVGCGVWVSTISNISTLSTISTISTIFMWVSAISTIFMWVSTISTKFMWVSTISSICMWVSTISTISIWVSTITTISKEMILTMSILFCVILGWGWGTNLSAMYIVVRIWIYNFSFMCGRCMFYTSIAISRSIMSTISTICRCMYFRSIR